MYDLRPYDADSLKGLPAPVLTEDEKHLEQLCDEERYLELHTDIAEKTMYEGEMKQYLVSLVIHHLFSFLLLKWLKDII